MACQKFFNPYKVYVHRPRFAIARVRQDLGGRNQQYL
jgi:hypothetical protein